MASDDNYVNGRMNVEIQAKNLEFASRHNLEATTSVSKNIKGNENPIHSEDQETMELNARARAQEKEIMYLREQIALATTKELQMLTEKYTLERKFSELRMALDEKQSEVITSAANELAQRKEDLEVNLNLHNELKVVEDERHIFTSGMLRILAEFGALPHVTNASALSNSIKYLHDRLQLKIRTSDGVHGFSHNSRYIDEKMLEPADELSRYVQERDSKVKSLTQNVGMHQLSNNQTMPDIDRNVAGNIADNMLDRNRYLPGSEQRSADQFFNPPAIHDGVGSFGSEDKGPGIKNFQIIGDAIPGNQLLGCGYPVRGTSLCMFQWVRHNPDGTTQYIEGATNPEYIVTADDVDKLIAVECIPMDEKGQQGELVRIFANDQNKIICDEEMQKEIDSYISKGLATFNVQILLDSSDNWEQATLLLRRSGFQVKVDKKQEVVISEKYSKELLIKIPGGLSPQFVLTCSNGSSYFFSTSNDIRLRDTLVVTVRIFQNKALDEKRKGKAKA